VRPAEVEDLLARLGCVFVTVRTGCATWRAAKLILVIAGTRGSIDECAMTENATPEVICPVCGRLMNFRHTIKCAFADNLHVFECRPCRFSMTEPAGWTTPVRSGATR